MKDLVLEVTPKLGFDLDGVIYPWNEMVYDNYVKNYLKLGDMTSYEFWEKEWLKYPETFWANVAGLVDMYTKIDINKEILATLNRLSQRYDICYVTVRPEDCQVVTKKWLRENNLPNYDKVYFSSNKSNEVRMLGLDYFVDDRPAIVESLKNLCKVFLVKQPHNKSAWDGEGYITINNVCNLERYL